MVGEIYGKQTASRLQMYRVIKTTKKIITLQNIDNPTGLFESTERDLAAAGYLLLSQTPYVDLSINKSKKRRTTLKPTRCPLTLDIFENRADSEKPNPIYRDLFE